MVERKGQNMVMQNISGMNRHNRFAEVEHAEMSCLPKR